MHFILGGRFQGKREYAEKIYGTFPRVYDLEKDNPASINSPGLILNVHSAAKTLLHDKISPYEFFMSRLEVLRPSVILCTEICGGIVPVDEFERLWRDETGRLYQLLAQEAEIVDRVFAGLALRLKG